MLYVSAETFDVMPRSGSATGSLTGVTSGKIYSVLKVTVLYLRDDEGHTLCLVSAPFFVDAYPFSNLLRTRLGEALGLTREQVAVFSTHNHSCVLLSDS
jgi:hypothetical protein